VIVNGYRQVPCHLLRHRTHAARLRTFLAAHRQRQTDDDQLDTVIFYESRHSIAPSKILGVEDRQRGGEQSVWIGYRDPDTPPPYVEG